MSEDERNPTRERLFDAAVTLFARKGYAAVGVREIAAVAEVNISMISYYYGGKIGILKAIIERFYEEYINIIRTDFRKELPVEEQIRHIIQRIVNLMKSKPDLCKIGITELPYDAPDIAKFKSERVLLVKELVFDNFFKRVGLSIDDKLTLSIISPAMISSIYSHFLLGAVIKDVLGVEFDDAFYRRYTETIATFIMKGITGVVSELET